MSVWEEIAISFISLMEKGIYVNILQPDSKYFSCICKKKKYLYLNFLKWQKKANNKL